MCLIGLVHARLCGGIEVHAHRSFVIGLDRHALQTPFPPSGIELLNGPKFRLPSLHSVLITVAARNPIVTIATQINGHSATSQKELLLSEFSEVGFFFMPLSQALEDRYFTKRENLFRAALRRQTDPDRCRASRRAARLSHETHREKIPPRKAMIVRELRNWVELSTGKA